MKDDYGSEYLAANYEFPAIGCCLISNMYNFTDLITQHPTQEIEKLVNIWPAVIELYFFEEEEYQP